MSDEGGMLWGGRFTSGPAEEMFRLTASIGIDIELLAADLAVTKAHARSLAAASLISVADVAAIDEACAAIGAEVERGDLGPGPHDEDVHSFVEAELTRRLGDVGARIHAGRSRNDLVATDLRLWCRAEAAHLASGTADLLEALAAVAEAHVETIMPGYTHLQRAQPVSLAFHLCAHGSAIARDGERFLAAGRSADVSPLGAGALAGTTLPIDPALAAEELGFGGTFDNAMDAVSDRDFVCDLLYAIALCEVHLSRFAEEVVLWTSAEFGFARLADRWSTGSSMMPQKRNPDLAELLRGRAAGGVADLTQLLVLLKGLPLAYDRDLQEDKGVVFRAVRRAGAGLLSAQRLVEALTFDGDRMHVAAKGGGAWATDLAELLVQRGVPFRSAHEATGRLVRSLEESGRGLEDVTAEQLSACHPAFDDADVGFAAPEVGLGARDKPGGTAPMRVLEQIEALRSRAKGLRSATER